MIISLLNRFIPLNTAFVFSVILIPTFGILYLLMLRSFPVISRILWLMVIIPLLIPKVLWWFIFNYYLINEVILFLSKKTILSLYSFYPCSCFGSPTRLVLWTIWVSQTLHNEPTIENFFSFTIFDFIFKSPHLYQSIFCVSLNKNWLDLTWLQPSFSQP